MDNDSNGQIEFGEFQAMLESVNLPTSALLAAVDREEAKEKGKGGDSGDSKKAKAAAATANGGGGGGADQWDEYEDPETGRKYFVNRSTGKTQWEAPAAVLDAWANSTSANGGTGEKKELTAKEIEDAKSVFKRFDADHSGAIDKDELAVRRSQHFTFRDFSNYCTIFCTKLQN